MQRLSVPGEGSWSYAHAYDGRTDAEGRSQIGIRAATLNVMRIAPRFPTLLATVHFSPGSAGILPAYAPRRAGLPRSQACLLPRV